MSGCRGKALEFKYGSSPVRVFFFSSGCNIFDQSIGIYKVHLYIPMTHSRPRYTRARSSTAFSFMCSGRGPAPDFAMYAALH